MHKLCRFDQRALKNWHPYLPFMDDFISLSCLLKVQSLTQLLNSQGVKIFFLFLQEDRTLPGWQEQAAGWSVSSLTQFSFPLHHFPTWKWPVENPFKRKMLVCPLHPKCFPNFCGIRQCSPFLTSMELHPWQIYFAGFFWQNLSFLNLLCSDFFFCSIFDALQVPDFRAGPSLANRVASFRW